VIDHGGRIAANCGRAKACGDDDPPLPGDGDTRAVPPGTPWRLCPPGGPRTTGPEGGATGSVAVPWRIGVMTGGQKGCLFMVLWNNG
jgi:hypothetical protein